MTIDGIIDARKMTQVLHFTTNLGLIGVLDAKAVLSRKRLGAAERLSYILRLNTPIVKDNAWVDYVNLSISRINSELFSISSDRWHRDVWWAILAFDPGILGHEGVWFVTANNIWPRSRRAEGPEGLEALFAPVVMGRYDQLIRRPGDMPPNFTTCDQAEVLYPGTLSTAYLHRIYVRSGEEQDEVCAQIEALGHAKCDVAIEPGMFGRAG